MLFKLNSKLLTSDKDKIPVSRSISEEWRSMISLEIQKYSKWRRDRSKRHRNRQIMWRDYFSGPNPLFGKDWLSHGPPPRNLNVELVSYKVWISFWDSPVVYCWGRRRSRILPHPDPWCGFLLTPDPQSSSNWHPLTWILLWPFLKKTLLKYNFSNIINSFLFFPISWEK